MNKSFNTILEKLKKLYPNVKTPLEHRNMYELFCAVLLSAQMNDIRLNRITPKLFTKYPDFSSLSKANIKEIRNILQDVNYYKTKSKHLIQSAQIISNQYNNIIPNGIEELIKLPGIGRKSANVIINEGYQKNFQGIVVDTHVSRLSLRLGFTKSKNPEKIEKDLMQVVRHSDWRNFSLLLIFHGKNICTAQKPKCNECIISKFCPTFNGKL